MDRLGDLRDILTNHYEDMRALIGGLRDADLDRKTDNGWSVRLLAGHIAASPTGDIYVLDRLTVDRNATIPKPLAFVLDIMNSVNGRRFRKASKADLLTEQESQYNALFAHVTALSEAQLDGRGSVFGMGELSAFEYLMQTPSHGREHAASIRSAIGQASENASSPV